MMNRTLMAAAIVLVAGSPLASAANSAPVNPAEFDTRTCSSVDYQLSTMKFKSETARQLTQEEADSLCRHNNDNHKAHAANGHREARPSSEG